LAIATADAEVKEQETAIKEAQTTENIDAEKEFQLSLDTIVSSVDSSNKLLAAHKGHVEQLKTLIS